MSEVYSTATPEETQANARLIAAAPEMYELLKVLCEVFYELLKVLRGVFVNLEHANPILSIFREVIEQTLARIDGVEANNE